ncbi:MAG: C39 family peptidase [Patescibacteria group bacterium]
MKKLQVPYRKQFNNNACGPAVLEMVYEYYGYTNISQEEILNQYKELEPHGSGNLRMITSSLIQDARKRGLSAGWARVNYSSLSDSIVVLKILIENSRIPIIVCQKFSDQQPQIGHFRIVIGVDEKYVYLNDPHPTLGGQDIQWSIEKFMDFWQPTGENVTGGVFCIIHK